MCRNRSTPSAVTRNQPVIIQTSNEQFDIMLKSSTGITPHQRNTFDDPLQIVLNGFKQKPIFIASDSQCHPLATALVPSQSSPHARNPGQIQTLVTEGHPRKGLCLANHAVSWLWLPARWWFPVWAWKLTGKNDKQLAGVWMSFLWAAPEEAGNRH